MLFVVEKYLHLFFFLCFRKQEMVNFKVIVTILLSVSHNVLCEKVLNKDSKGR